jgi:hypothetical protein
MYWKFGAVIAIAMMTAACGTPEVIVHKPETPVRVVAENDNTRAIQLKRITYRMPAGQHMGVVRAGLLCVNRGDLTTKEVNTENRNIDLTRRLEQELKRARYNIVGDANDPFSEERETSADLLLAATVVEFKMNVCFPMAGFGSASSKGEVGLTVEWQVFSRQAKAVIYTVKTTGSAKLDDAQSDGMNVMQGDALLMSLRELMRDEGFYKTVTAPMPKSPPPRAGTKS